MIQYETNRLLLRNHHPDDINNILEYTYSVHNLKFDNYSPKSKEELFDELSKIQSDDRYWVVILKENNKVIGDLEYEEVEFGTYSIGYSFNENFCNQGYATEACEVLVNHVFLVVGARRISIDISVANIPSWRVAEKLGFRREGKLIYDDVLVNVPSKEPIYSSSFLYALLQSEWLERVTLEELSQEDKDLFATWLNQEFIYKWFCPDGEEEKQSWLDEVYDKNDHAYQYIVKYKCVKIGFAQYVDMYYEEDYALEIYQRAFSKNEAYEISYCIGDESYLGRGLGKKIILALENKVRLQGGKMILADPAEENIRSVSTLLSAGFMKIKDGDYRKKI